MEFEIFKIYNYTSDTQEFISESDGYTDENTPLIPYCTIYPAPPKKEGYAIIFNSEASEWAYKADHRGKIAYNTETTEKAKIDFIGEIEPLFTFLEPQTESDVWDGEKWVAGVLAQDT